LDGALANQQWIQLFLKIVVIVLPWVFYDHNPLLVDTDGKQVKPWQFEEFWL